MDANSQWLNILFKSFVKGSNVRLVFEDETALRDTKPVLNLSIHPIRFANDIFFNFATNDETVLARLKEFEVDYNIFYHYADLIKATYIKSVKKKSIPPHSMLLVGQTGKDKVVFDGNKYLVLTDFLQEIQDATLKYDHVYFKPHPYALGNRKVYRALKRVIPKLKVIHDNIYYLLANNNIQHVMGLNSSMLYEAKYFNKQTTFLFKQSFDLGNTDIGVYVDYFNSYFWSRVLDIPDTKLQVPLVANQLRKAINDFWGYNTISDEIILKDIIKGKMKHLIAKYGMYGADVI